MEILEPPLPPQSSPSPAKPSTSQSSDTDSCSQDKPEIVSKTVKQRLLSEQSDVASESSAACESYGLDTDSQVETSSGSRSWAEMVDEPLDVEHLPPFEGSPQKPVKITKHRKTAEERERLRKERKANRPVHKIEAVSHDDECFD